MNAVDEVIDNNAFPVDEDGLEWLREVLNESYGLRIKGDECDILQECVFQVMYNYN